MPIWGTWVKFLHINSKFCKFGQECDNKMCSFWHAKEKEQSDNLANLNDAEKSYMEDNNSTDKSVNFVTSTPKKIECEECRNQSQCDDCFVRQENPEHFPNWQGTLFSTPDRVQQVADKMED